MLNTIQQFFEACHPFGYPLLACSIVLFAAILYHLKVRFLAGDTVGAWTMRLKNARHDAEMYAQCRQQLHELGQKDYKIWLIEHLLNNKDLEDLTTYAESKLRSFIEQSRGGMSTIAIITNIAPMLGILGTAWGLVDIFGIFGTPGAQEGIALGISKALYTTIFGLAIAVPGLIAQICFERSLEQQAALLNEQFTFLLAHRHEI